MKKYSENLRLVQLSPKIQILVNKIYTYILVSCFNNLKNKNQQLNSLVDKHNCICCVCSEIYQGKNKVFMSQYGCKYHLFPR